MITKLMKDDGNITSLRIKYGKGLHWVIGDTHSEVHTLHKLMEKINFDPDNDRVYFLGDYNSGGNTYELLRYISRYYQTDHGSHGFHLIRGNHERECSPVFPLGNMPDIIVIKGYAMNYFLVHAGMTASAFELINADMAASPEKWYFAYSLTDKSTAYNAPLRQLTWSKYGLYSQHSRPKIWPDEAELTRSKACIIHGHTPYCFFSDKMHSYYGRRSLFWKKQHIWFSEDLQSFDIDSNVKGREKKGESYRGLSCICLEAIEEIAEKSGNRLNISSIEDAENFVFTSDYTDNNGFVSSGTADDLLNATPEMKTIDTDIDGKPFIAETDTVRQYFPQY